MKSVYRYHTIFTVSDAGILTHHLRVKRRKRGAIEFFESIFECLNLENGRRVRSFPHNHQFLDRGSTNCNTCSAFTYLE